MGQVFKIQHFYFNFAVTCNTEIINCLNIKRFLSINSCIKTQYYHLSLYVPFSLHQVAKHKMMLTHLVVRPGMGAATLSKTELDSILK